eukprot:TRINITY_DN5085_c0_g1_i4.p1 TRINITY_DN5085_c0_g1~~TRINITY_DN5085_c0_g1_i4.p1  ORF type:complete len:175 (+),score=47.09 TRINITY_DN5085_c0_g1_i4:100-624(+)
MGNLCQLQITSNAILTFSWFDGPTTGNYLFLYERVGPAEKEVMLKNAITGVNAGATTSTVSINQFDLVEGQLVVARTATDIRTYAVDSHIRIRVQNEGNNLESNLVTLEGINTLGSDKASFNVKWDRGTPSEGGSFWRIVLVIFLLGVVAGAGFFVYKRIKSQRGGRDTLISDV